MSRVFVKRSTGHTHTPTENNTPDTDTHTQQEQHPTPPNEHPPQILNNARRQYGDNSPAPGRAHGHSYYITRSTSFTAVSFICNDFTAVGYADRARAWQPRLGLTAAKGAPEVITISCKDQVVIQSGAKLPQALLWL